MTKRANLKIIFIFDTLNFSKGTRIRAPKYDLVVLSRTEYEVVLGRTEYKYDRKKC